MAEIVKKLNIFGQEYEFASRAAGGSGGGV
jgi:hypothetical protein